MATAQLNAEPAKAEDRIEANLPPKSFADAVEQGPAVEETVSARSADAPVSQNSTEGGQEIRNGVKEESIAMDEPISTDGIANGVLNGVEAGKVQKMEVGEKKPDLTAVNGSSEDTRSSGESSDNSTPSQSPEKVAKTEPTPKVESKDEHAERSRRSSINKGLPSRSSTLSFRSGSGYAEPFEDTEFEDTDLFESFRDGVNGEELVSIRTPRSPKVSKAGRKMPAMTPAPRVDEDRKALVSGREAGRNWHQSRIRFAPLNIPLQRRLQTLIVLLHTLCLAGGISIFLFMCAIPLLWPIIVPYMIYIMFSKAGTSGELSYRSDRWRKSKIWSLFASYFPARLHRTSELSPTRKYIFGYHPHGIISHGAFAAFGTEALGFDQLFPGITNSLLTLDSNFRIPLYREYALFLGLASVSRQSCENILSKGGLNGEGMGRAITIVVGGARESLDAMPYTMKLTLKRRYGFVKMAMRTGADLVPVLAFGENELYDQFSVENRPWIRGLQYAMKSMMGWTLPLFHARGVFNYDVGMLPYRRPVNIVVGRPIMVKQNRKPTMEEVESVHSQYCEELTRIWETWKDDFAPNRKGEMKISD